METIGDGGLGNLSPVAATGRVAGSLHSLQSPEGSCAGNAVWCFAASTTNLAMSPADPNCFSAAFAHILQSYR